MSLGTRCAVCKELFSRDRPRSESAWMTCVQCAHPDIFEHCAKPHPVNEFPEGRWISRTENSPTDGAITNKK